MKLLKQLWLLILFYLLGEFIAHLIPSPLPGNVIGFILLFIALQSGYFKSEYIDSIADFFLKNLAIFFIPGGVGLIKVLHLFEGNILKIALIVILSTFLTMLATAGTILLLERLKR